MKNIILIFLATVLISGCSGFQPIRPSQTAIPSPSATPPPSLTPSPISTETPTPTPTSTTIPTVQFRSSNPTIVATSASCSTGLPNKICVSALNITLSGRTLNEYEVIVNWPGFSGASFLCPQQATLVSFGENLAPVICSSKGITFVSVGLTELTLTIKWDGGSYAQTLYPNYEAVFPQGPDCEPQCSIGEAEIAIP